MPRQSSNSFGDAVRLEDVARHAGVSIATASRAIHGARGRVVSEELRVRVIAAAAQLGYVPNVTAQAMARGRGDSLGLIVHDISDPYFSAIAAGVMTAARRSGGLVTLAVTDRDPDQELAHVKAFRHIRSRAVILVGSLTTSRRRTAALAAELAAFESEGGRVVVVSQPRLPVDTLAIDNRGGARALAAELAALGYRRFGVLSGPRALLTAADRVDGFRRGLAQHGLATHQVVAGEFDRDGGYRAMAALLDAPGDVECVFAANDVMAVGALACLRDRGLDAPGGVAIAGFDDIPTLRDVTPALTTVRVPLQVVGESATDLALAPSAGSPRTERIATEVVLRASTPGPDGRPRRGVRRRSATG